MSEQNRSRQAWRNAGQADRKREGGAAWRRDLTPAEKTKLGWSWQAKLGTGLVALAVLCAGLVWLIYLLIPPRVPYWVAVGPSYCENLALKPTPHAYMGQRDVLKWLAADPAGGSWWGKERPRPSRTEPLEAGPSDPWFKDLDASFREESIVIYLSLHGYSDSHEAFLVGDGPWSESRIAVADVLKRLEQLPPKKNKLLILDAVHATADPYHGMLHNDFVRRLKALNDRIDKISNLAVLISCDEDERSWTYDDGHSTIFAHYVLEGLKGAADANHNGRVDAEELYEYVRRQVRRWVWYNRGDVQQPILLPANGGAEKARSITLSVVKNDYKESERVAPSQADRIPQELMERWKECEALANAVPSPAVYSPELWAEYRDVLLRLESIERAAGADTDSAGSRLASSLGALRVKLDQLKARIEGQRSLVMTHGSDDLSLPMPTALGQDAVKVDALQLLFDDLWADPEKNRAKWDEMAKWAKAQGHIAEKRLPALVARMLLQKVSESGKGQDEAAVVNRTAKVLDIAFSERGSNRPAELHFLDMLLRDLPRNGKRPGGLLATAVQTRLLAEDVALATRATASDTARFYSYSEQVYPWIRAQVQTADDARRRGEDLLFSSVNTDWSRASTFLAQANSAYGEALKIASTVRQSLQARDEVFADLPFYTLWLTRRNSEPQLRNEARKIWEGAHRLSDHVQGPPSPEALKDLEAFTKLADQVHNLKAQHLKKCQELTDARSDTQDTWWQIEAALSVPTIPAPIRERLLDASVAVARQLHRGTSSGSEKDLRLDVKQQHDERARASVNRGTLALARLGKMPIDKSGGEVDSPTWAQAEPMLANALHQEKWWQPLAEVGDQLGAGWQQLVPRTQKALDIPTRAILADVRTALVTAEALSRVVPGFAFDAAAISPASDARRLRTHGLLLWQAERAYGDHWFAYALGQPIYYQKAIKTYLDDASDLMTRPGMPSEVRDRRLAEVEKARLELTPSGLIQPAKADIPITDQSRFSVKIEIKADKKLPEGFATLWVEPSDDAFRLAPDELMPARWGGHRPIAIHASQAVAEHYDLIPNGNPPNAPHARSVPTRAVALFRGQKIKSEHDLRLQRQPHIVIYEDPRPKTGSLAIAADKTLDEQFAGKNSALVIIMDCSGSMKETDETGQRRFDRATKALEQVLPRIAPGTRVSLWVFAQEDQLRGRPPSTIEETIVRLVDPAPWNPGNAAQMAQFKRVAGLTPAYSTPLVRTMMEARKDLDEVDIEGHKVMLILTDGMDTHFEKRGYPKEVGADPSPGDPKYNPKGDQKIPEFLPKAFQDSGIELKIIGFQLNGVEKVLAEQQFKKPLEALQPPGEFFTVDKQNQLIERLTEALRPVLWCHLTDSKGAPAAPRQQVPRSTDQFKWIKQGIALGHYDLIVGKHHQDVQIDSGDVMMIRLRRGGYELPLARNYSDRRGQKAGDWVVGVPQNQLKDEHNAVQMLVTLERTRRPTQTGTLKLVKPEFVYFELATQEKLGDVAVDWMPAFGYFAPAWRLDVKEWPRTSQGTLAAPMLDVYWLDEDVRGQLVGSSQAIDANHFPAEGMPISGEGFSVTLDKPESARQYSIDQTSRKESLKNCLILRMRYEKDKPVMVRIPELNATGSVHRYYQDVNQYTAIFWPVNEDLAKSGLLRLEFISLDKVKSLAQQRQTHVQLSLDVPSLSDASPTRYRLPDQAGER